MYSDVDKKAVSRRSSISVVSAGSRGSRSSSVSSRISDVTPPSSRAPSISSQASFVSQYRKARDISLSKGAAIANGNASTRLGHAKYSEIMSRPEDQPVTIEGESQRTKSRRIVNLRLRKIIGAEREDYAAHLVGSKQTFYTEQDLANAAGLYKLAATYMLDFDIVNEKTPVPCTVRLSNCGTPGRTLDAALLHVLRYSQRELESNSASVELPQGLVLRWATFPCGLFGSRPKACAAQLDIDDNIVEDGMTVHSAAFTGFSGELSYEGSYWERNRTEEARIVDNKERALGNYRPFIITVCMPGSTLYRPGHSVQHVKWNKLQGLETAFPDWLYGRDIETVKQWLGPFGKNNRSLHFEVRDVKFNLKGDIINARLIKIAGPKFIKPPKPEPAPVPSTPATPVSHQAASDANSRGRKKGLSGLLSTRRG